MHVLYVYLTEYMAWRSRQQYDELLALQTHFPFLDYYRLLLFVRATVLTFLLYKCLYVGS